MAAIYREPMLGLSQYLPHRRVFAALLFGVGLAGCQSNGGTIILCRADGRFLCPNGLYCALNENCGGLDLAGECRPLPRDCPTTEEPVCSCNGKNFENECYANASGESVAYRGRCMK